MTKKTHVNDHLKYIYKLNEFSFKSTWEKILLIK
jgi:hypothetical protein